MHQRINVAVSIRHVFTMISLYLLTGAGLPLVGMDASSPDRLGGSLLLQGLWAAMYGITTILLVLRGRHSLRVARRSMGLWMLTAVALASLAWSAFPLTTLRNGIGFVGTTLFGLYLATYYTHEELLRLLAKVMLLLTAVQLVFAIIEPSSLSGHENAVAGAFATKNTAGRTMALAAMILMLQALSANTYRIIWWIGYAVSVALALLSSSATALILCIVIPCLIPVFRSLRLRITLLVPLVALLVVVGAGLSIWLFRESETLLGALGKDVTLTGRSGLWLLVWEVAKQRPWIGYGYGGFWSSWDSPAAVIWVTLKWAAPHAHNGLLDLWLQLGIVGVITFGMSLWSVVATALRVLRRGRTYASLLPGLFLAFLFVSNTVSSALMVQNNILWVLYSALCFFAYMEIPDTESAGL